MTDAQTRERMEFDVVIVGAGPAGLAAAIRLGGQLSAQQDHPVSVAVLEGAIAAFALDRDAQPQTYGLGQKVSWTAPEGGGGPNYTSM